MAGKGKKNVKLIDDETFVFLGNQTKEDYNIAGRIGIEKHITEFRYDHAERFNNWQTDELYIEQANTAEAGFLEKIHDSEMQNVLLRHVSLVYRVFFLSPKMKLSLVYKNLIYFYDCFYCVRLRTLLHSAPFSKIRELSTQS